MTTKLCEINSFHSNTKRKEGRKEGRRVARRDRGGGLALSVMPGLLSEPI